MMKRSTTPLEGDEQKSSLTARVVSGSIGSILTSLAVTPLEVVKIRVQAASSEPAGTAAAKVLPYNARPCPHGCGTFVLNNGLMDCLLPKNAVSFFDQKGKLTQQARLSFQSNGELGTFGMVRRIFLQEGLPGIYAGLRPTLVMAVPNTVLYFSTYEEIVWRMRRECSNPALSSWMPLIAGGMARLLASSFTAPFELLRTRQAAEVGRNRPAVGLMREFQIIVQNEGYAALYRGLAPTLWRDVPFSGIYWMAIESFREMWKQRAESPPTPAEMTGQAFINGAVAGTIAACFTTPMDVVKTREQAVANTSNVTTSQRVGTGGAMVCCHNGADVYKAPSTPHRAAGTLAFMRYIARTEGLAGLWRGNQSRMIKVAPSCAIMISSYELGKRLLA